MPALLIQKQIYLSDKKKKKKKLLYALARHQILSAKEGFCSYKYKSISPAIGCLIVFQSVWSVV